jgi:rare lipoprotein A (peptidoglycan hydrolase)
MRHTLSALTLFSLTTSCLAHPTYCGKASVHGYTHSGYVTAARGVRRGTTLEVWDPKRPGTKLRVRVVDACGYPMKRMGRILDLSLRTSKRLYGSTTGVHPVRYRILRNGKGAYCGKGWATQR